jgi:AcrR family transcriptional regulator
MSDPGHSAGRPRSRPSAARAILEAADAVLLEEGVDGVSIRRVSRRCGFTAPTIYHHFGDKTGLIDGVLEERFRAVLERMSAIPRGGDPAQTLREMARVFVRFALANPDHYRLLSVPRSPGAAPIPSAEAARELVKGALEDLARAGALGTSDTEAAFQVLWAVLHGLISLHLTRPDYAFAEDLMETAFEMVERGLLRRGEAAR